MMSEQKANGIAFDAIAQGAALSLLIYLVLPGPLVYLDAKHLWPYWMQYLLWTVYSPLVWTVEHSEAIGDVYLEYLLWWKSLALGL